MDTKIAEVKLTELWQALGDLPPLQKKLKLDAEIDHKYRMAFFKRQIRLMVRETRCYVDGTQDGTAEGDRQAALATIDAILDLCED